MTQQRHPVAENILNWLSEAITATEAQARVSIVNDAVESFVQEFNKHAQPTATTESGEPVEVEEVTESK